MTQKKSHPFKVINLLGLLILAGLLLAACQPAASIPLTGATSVPTKEVIPTSTSTTTSAIEEPTLSAATDPVLGSILVDGKGMTLYMFTKDEAGKSNCDAACLAKWPPLLTNGSPKGGEGVDTSMLGSAVLADGRKIVTYNQMPLYYWVNDTKKGDTTGQNVGAVWFVVNPDGNPVMEAAAAMEEPTLMAVADPILGNIVVDGKGMTLYMFTKDEAGKSNCDAECLAKWPPLLTNGSPKAGEGIDDSKLGSVVLADGRKIVTYNQMPLYYWVKDTKKGDTTGQNVGTVWFVVNPDGKPVMEAANANDNTNANDNSDDNGKKDDASADVTINVVTDPNLGKILVDGKGMTLYLFTKDQPGKSNCSGNCLVAWPPLLTKGNPTLGPGVDASKVGSAKLGDGSQIVTYAGMPLYYYVQDTQAGDTTGQGVGGVWYIVAP
jgi:predicted lipoprotein with Yx(FWY)xxD motif